MIENLFKCKVSEMLRTNKAKILHNLLVLLIFLVVFEIKATFLTNHLIMMTDKPK